MLHTRRPMFEPFQTADRKKRRKHVYAIFIFRLQTTACFPTSLRLTACPGQTCMNGQGKKVTGCFSMFSGGEL